MTVVVFRRHAAKHARVNAERRAAADAYFRGFEDAERASKETVVTPSQAPDNEPIKPIEASSVPVSQPVPAQDQRRDDREFRHGKNHRR